MYKLLFQNITLLSQNITRGVRHIKKNSGINLFSTMFLIIFCFCFIVAFSSGAYAGSTLGTNPKGTNPLGTNPLGTNPKGTNPKGSGLKQLPINELKLEIESVANEIVSAYNILAAAGQKSPGYKPIYEQIKRQISWEKYGLLTKQHLALIFPEGADPDKITILNYAIKIELSNNQVNKLKLFFPTHKISPGGNGGKRTSIITLPVTNILTNPKTNLSTHPELKHFEENNIVAPYPEYTVKHFNGPEISQGNVNNGGQKNNNNENTKKIPGSLFDVYQAYVNEYGDDNPGEKNNGGNNNKEPGETNNNTAPGEPTQNVIGSKNNDIDNEKIRMLLTKKTLLSNVKIPLSKTTIALEDFENVVTFGTDENFDTFLAKTLRFKENNNVTFGAGEIIFAGLDKIEAQGLTAGSIFTSSATINGEEFDARYLSHNYESPQQVSGILQPGAGLTTYRMGDATSSGIYFNNAPKIMATSGVLTLQAPIIINGHVILENTLIHNTYKTNNIKQYGFDEFGTYKDRFQIDKLEVNKGFTRTATSGEKDENDTEKEAEEKAVKTTAFCPNGIVNASVASVYFTKFLEAPGDLSAHDTMKNFSERTSCSPIPSTNGLGVDWTARISLPSDMLEFRDWCFPKPRVLTSCYMVSRALTGDVMNGSDAERYISVLCQGTSQASKWERCQLHSNNPPNMVGGGNVRRKMFVSSCKNPKCEYRNIDCTVSGNSYTCSNPDKSYGLSLGAKTDSYSTMEEVWNKCDCILTPRTQNVTCTIGAATDSYHFNWHSYSYIPSNVSSAMLTEWGISAIDYSGVFNLSRRVDVTPRGEAKKVCNGSDTPAVVFTGYYVCTPQPLYREEFIGTYKYYVGGVEYTGENWEWRYSPGETAPQEMHWFSGSLRPGDAVENRCREHITRIDRYGRTTQEIDYIEKIIFTYIDNE